jgi:hypothetical protein
MLAQLAEAGHPPEPEWLAMFLAASAASASSTTPQQARTLRVQFDRQTSKAASVSQSIVWFCTTTQVAQLLHAATDLGLFDPSTQGTQAGDLTAAQWVDTLLAGCRVGAGSSALCLAH